MDLEPLIQKLELSPDDVIVILSDQIDDEVLDELASVTKNFIILLPQGSEIRTMSHEEKYELATAWNEHESMHPGP